MSGHSRWHQIRHRKALTDAKKGKLFSKMARLIAVAAKEKGADPAMNSKLRMAVESARAVGMPKENIERAISRGAGGIGGEAFEEVRYEAYGPGGAALLILGVTDNKNRTTSEVKHLLAEYAGKLAIEGSVAWLFKKMGAVDFPKESVGSAPEELTLTLIDAGADDVQEFPEGFTAYVNPDSLEEFKEELGRKGLAFSRVRVDYVPTNPILLSEDDKAKLASLLEALDEHDDVQEVYTNVNL